MATLEVLAWILVLGWSILAIVYIVVIGVLNATVELSVNVLAVII